MNTASTNIGFIFLLVPVFLALNYFDVVQWPIWVIIAPMVAVFLYMVYTVYTVLKKHNGK